MELKEVYDVIGDDLAKVDEELDAVCKVSLQWLSEMLEHGIKGAGKRIRPSLTLLCGKLHTYDLNVLLPMATSIELMHTATLIHDDAIDKSMVRRGRSTVYKVFGLEKTVLLGDYIFAKAGDEVADTHSIRAIKLFCQTLMIISQGELDQARNLFNLYQTREQYLKRIFSKTASLFSLSTESGGILSQAPESAIRALRDYGCNLGIAFQIIDDVLDFTGTEQELGKPGGSDLAQGTLTLPALLLNERYPKDNPVKRVFQNRGGQDDIKTAIEQVRNSDIVDECYKFARGYAARACSDLSTITESQYIHVLKGLATFVVERNR